MKLLIDTVHSAGADDRIDKGKGKPILYRYEGETVKGEKEARARDPRKEVGFKAGKYRTELYTTSYEVCYAEKVLHCHTKLIHCG